MTATLDGKRAIVTGGGQGVGRGIALALAAEGAAVALVGRTEAKLLAVAAEIQKPGGTALPVVADVNRPADIQRCVAHTAERSWYVPSATVNAGKAGGLRAVPAPWPQAMVRPPLTDSVCPVM